jgi:hypothetical protein
MTPILQLFAASALALAATNEIGAPLLAAPLR